MFGHSKKLWWAIDGVLAGMGIPYIDWQRRYNFGGDLNAFEDDLFAIHREGIRAVVSLLNHPGDAPIFQSAGFEFKCLPIADGHPPSLDQARDYIAFVDACRAKGLPVVTHCVGGIGRTGTMICSYLIHTGMSADEAIAHARAKEPSAVETGLQLQFLRDFEKLR
jgi:protein tyrosine phosphatase (PTP) superfamily phosphohydrolase (DUF442 family)